LRGYAGQSRRLAKKLELGEPVSSLPTDILLAALAATGQAPNSYSAKLNLNLKPGMRSDEATRIIMRRLLDTIEANEAGIRADIDIEYLHDYRVAIRRTRSALSQIRNVFPAERTEHFKDEFRELGQRTNQLRDLDVYLLAEADYRAMLPEILQKDIDPLFAFLREQRIQAHRYVVEGFDAPAYRQRLSEWRDFINQSPCDDPTAPNAALPIIDLARKRIDKRYRRIVTDGAYILDHTEDELLHGLRIECKKLRYLLEFFAALFPRKRTNRLIKELKRLQENLGDFSDLSVQQAALMSMAEELPDGDPTRGRALIATGALVETLARRQQAVKANFAATFTTFAAPVNQKEYRSLFKSKSKRRKK
jgi:CHAD domain-containing protein